MQCWFLSQQTLSGGFLTCSFADFLPRHLEQLENLIVPLYQDPYNSEAESLQTCKKRKTQWLTNKHVNTIVTEKRCLIWVLHVTMNQLPRRFLDLNIVSCWILISFRLMKKALSEKNNGKNCHNQYKQRKGLPLSVEKLVESLVIVKRWKVLPLSVKEAERLVIITKQWERVALWGWTG